MLPVKTLKDHAKIENYKDLEVGGIYKIANVNQIYMLLSKKGNRVNVFVFNNVDCTGHYFEWSIKSTIGDEIVCST